VQAKTERSLRATFWLGVMAFLLGVVRIPAQAAAPGTFVPLGPMATGRHAPTVTLLSDGTVLFTGGEARNGIYILATRTTERFDPKTNQFAFDAPMIIAREFHSAALLKDGRVLVLGGTNQFNSVLASAEVYDPASRTFAPVGRMAQGRWLATATLLQDGRVLVVGGFTDSNGTKLTKTAELFDPATATFQQTGSLSQGRTDHRAVLLSDGRVAILSGLDEKNQTVRSVEIYDPKTGSFTVQGQTTVSHIDGAALLVPGDKILLAGGFDGAVGSLSSIEVYDPATGQATVIGYMSEPRDQAVVVTLADGQILVAGGVKDANTIFSSAELIDPVTGQATPTGSMNEKRQDARGVLLPDGRVLIATTGDKDTFQTAEIYIPPNTEGAAPGG
jgi:hypothetical protein